MTKKLLVQIKNEWRNNLWLALELLVVSVVMWFVVDYLYTRTATYLEPRGFDISHCYLIEMGKLTDKSPDYIPNRTDEQEDADILELVDRLRRRPEIEAVSLSQTHIHIMAVTPQIWCSTIRWSPVIGRYAVW